MNKQQKPKGGQLSRTAAMLCKNPTFRLWLDRRAKTRFGLQLSDGTHTEEDARDFILKWCEVSSRAHIDNNPKAIERLKYVIHRFNIWAKKQ